MRKKSILVNHMQSAQQNQHHDGESVYSNPSHGMNGNGKHRKVHRQQITNNEKKIDIRYLQIINLMGTFIPDTMCINSKPSHRIAIRPKLNSHGSMHFVCGVELKTTYRHGSRRIGRNAVRIRCVRHSDSFHV